MSEMGLELDSVVKTCERRTLALDRLTLAVPRGSFCGLLGRNGAGKTTALRVALGLLRPDEGRARILGEEYATAPPELRARVAYVPQEVRLPARFTVSELALYLAGMYPGFDRARARLLAKRLEVPWERKVGTLSVGNRRKAACLLALASGARVLLLDEPAAGLDPIARRELSDVLIEMLSDELAAADEGLTVVLSTHLVGDLERLASRVAFVDEGRVVLSEAIEALLAGFRRVQVVLDDVEKAPSRLELPGVRHVRRSGSVIHAVVELPSEGALEPLRRTPGLRVEAFPLTLEEVFVEVVGPAPDDPARVSVGGGEEVRG